MKVLENLVDLDLVIILILGASLFVISPELQGNIIAGMIGFLGAKTVSKVNK